ncbi:DALR domain-containing protein, partial [Thermodesulfobacteriota bacterium]
GDGRPGWHIECSTMSVQYLGDTIDIHGGGVDLVFPHHENEVAQSEAATGKPFVRTWMHNGLLTVGGEKMSKSLGNYHTIEDLLAGNHPEVIRYFLIASHYRSPIDFTEDRLQEAQKRLDYFYGLLQRLEEAISEGFAAAGGLAEDLDSGFRTSMEDDFNIPAVLGVLSSVAGRAQKALDDIATGSPSEDEGLTGLGEAIRRTGDILGLFQEDPVAWFKWTPEAKGGGDAEIEALVEARTQARRDRDWKKADQLRDELKVLGIVIEDGPKGTTWRRAR